MTAEEKSSGRIGQDMAIRREVAEGRGPIYEDYINAPKENKELLKKIRKAYYKRLKVEYGKDIFEEKIPLAAGQEQTTTPDESNRMGGVWIDEHCMSNIKGLFAIGDASCSKLSLQHPDNGTDLGWALLSGGYVGQFATEYVKNCAAVELDEVKEQAEKYLAELNTYQNKKDGSISVNEFKDKLIEIMIPYDVNHRNDQAMEACLAKLDNLEKEFLSEIRIDDLHALRGFMEAKSMIKVAKMILGSEYTRKESRIGVHRDDYPLMDNENWLKWIGICKEDDKMEFFTEDVPEKYYELPRDIRPAGHRL